MDPYNFSFFEDKAQESEMDAEKTSSLAPSSQSEAPNPTSPSEDPFDFSAFDMGENGSQPPGPDLAGDEIAAPSANIEVTNDLDALESFDLSDSPSSASVFRRKGSQSDPFPNMALTAEEAPDSEAFEMGFADTDPKIEKVDDSFSELELAPFASAATETNTESGDDLGFGSLDSFEVTEMGESFSLDLPSGVETPVAEPPTESEELNAPEIATVLPPIEPTEIRASVVPAVFLSPTPAAPTAEPEGKEEMVEEVEPAPREAKAKPKPARFLTTDDPYGEVAPPRERLRVAILGASGIGKNHARWFARHSCDIVSFLGSSAESVELTRSHLQAHMGFAGRGYSDLGRLLSETQPQAVCIASPSELHYAQAMQCLEAGIHVLCEKPLVYSPGRSKRENADGARELLKAAAKRNLVLGTQLQYGAATPILCRLAGVSPFEVGDFAMEIETTNPKSPRDPKQLWIDLAPHPLSVAQYLAGDGAEIVGETLQIVPSRSAYTSEVSARFGVRCDGGRLLMCRVIVRGFDKIVDNREPRRRFSFNGRVVQYSGVRSPDGNYIAQYVAPDGYISHYSDPVDYLIGNFVRTCWEDDQLILSAEQGVQNLDWLLSTVEKL